MFEKRLEKNKQQKIQKYFLCKLVSCLCCFFVQNLTNFIHLYFYDLYMLLKDRFHLNNNKVSSFPLSYSQGNPGCSGSPGTKGIPGDVGNFGPPGDCGPCGPKGHSGVPGCRGLITVYTSYICSSNCLYIIYQRFIQPASTVNNELKLNIKLNDAEKTCRFWRVRVGIDFYIMHELNESLLPVCLSVYHRSTWISW